MSTRGVAPAVPDVVAERQRWAREHGFERSCTDDVGRLLAWLAGGLAPGSRVLELGSGAGVGLAWLASGAAEATGVHITSIERDPVLAAALRDVSWPAEVNLVEGDSLKFVRDSQDGFDLVFADAEGGKTTGLTATVSRVRSPGGLLVVDDMAWQPDEPAQAALWAALVDVREALRGDARLHTAELDGIGAMVCRRVRA